MQDIIIRTTDGRVQTWGDTITFDGQCFEIMRGPTKSIDPVNTFPFPVELVTGAAAPPSDCVGGYNYNFVSGNYVASGTPVPTPPS